MTPPDWSDLPDEIFGTPDRDPEAVVYEVERDVDEIAYNVGCEVMHSHERILMIDLDGEEEKKRFETLLYVFGLVAFRFVKREDHRSRNGGYHIVLYTEHDMDIRERVMLQAVLGSDPMREVYNFARIWQGVEPVITLFRPKGAKTEVVFDLKRLELPDEDDLPW